jgi:sulfite reductase alpha subunit-like flavoprotein
MKDNTRLVSELIIEKKCYILLVGSSKILPKYVDITLVEILSKENNFVEDEAKRILNNMKLSGKYYTETW